jgi:transglutaminase-like putative cysteine protease
MSAGVPTVTVAPRFARPRSQSGAVEAGGDRAGVRLAAFAALGLYGVLRWSTLLHPAPTWRLAGLLILSVALAAGVGPLRRLALPVAIGATLLLALLAFPMAGLPWHYLTHLRIAVSADWIGTGLQNLPGVLVPYLGTNHLVRLVIVLGAAVLLLDAAVVMAFSPRPFSDPRRATAALPLVALAVVPAALVRPQLPYLQGLVLFALLAAFMWGDRVRRDAVATAVAVAAVAGVAGAILAPRLDPHRPWVNYRAWAGSTARPHLDAFAWNQTYGPLHWPRSGHVVLTIQAQHGDYWKAEDLDYFNGFAWQAGGDEIASALPSPDPGALQRWTQRLQVTIKGMKTNDVIAAGYSTAPAVAGNVQAGTSAGTWTTARPLGPGTAYRVLSYSPQPSEAQLRQAGEHYPDGSLVNYLTLSIPNQLVAGGTFPPITFPIFHTHEQPYVAQGSEPVRAGGIVRSSPYGDAYRLARRLAATAATPYAFGTAVHRYLAHGFTYNEKPPLRRYPLEGFLFKDRIGYCQQFSGAMALLLRMGGVPARVASGFAPGNPDADNHVWTVSDIDAHAWVEVWFPHYGWVRFDPTPASAPARGGSSSLPISKGTGAASDSSSGRPARVVDSSSGSSAEHHHSAGGGVNPLLVVCLVVVLVAVALLIRSLLTRPSSAEDLVDELERALARSGRPLADGVTLAALEQRFRSSPTAAAYVRTLRVSRYAGGGARPTPAQRRALRRQLRFGLGLSGRLRALWALPPRLRLGRARAAS